MQKQRGFTLFEMLVVIVGLVFVGGWISNIVKIVGTFDHVVTGMFTCPVLNKLSSEM